MGSQANFSTDREMIRYFESALSEAAISTEEAVHMARVLLTGLTVAIDKVQELDLQVKHLMDSVSHHILANVTPITETRQ